MKKIKPIKKGIKSNVNIKSKSIYLREIQLSDVNKKYYNWMKNAEVTQYLESRFENWSLRKLKDYVRRIKNNPDYIFLAIISKDKNRHIGNIKLGPISRIHNFADVGIIIGQKLFLGKGIGSEAISIVVDYAFNKLNLHKLTAGAYAKNIASIKAFEKAGFSVEGIRKKQYLYNGKYIDGILLGIVRK